MKKIGLLIGTGPIILTGCVQPQFNPNKKQIIFIEGKPFRVPYSTSNIGYRYTNSAEDKERIETYKKEGLICRVGDVLWVENSTAKKGLEIMSSKGKLEAYTYIGKMAREGKSGCVHSMSSQEYSHYRGKEMEAREDDIRARTALGNAFSSAGDSFKTNNYNVNVSGTVNHNVNVTSNPYYRY